MRAFLGEGEAAVLVLRRRRGQRRDLGAVAGDRDFARGIAQAHSSSAPRACCPWTCAPMCDAPKRRPTGSNPPGRSCRRRARRPGSPAPWARHPPRSAGRTSPSPSDRHRRHRRRGRPAWRCSSPAARSCSATPACCRRRPAGPAAQAIGAGGDQQPVFLRVLRAALGDLLEQRRHGRVGLAQLGVVAGAEAGLGRHARRPAELSHDHVIAFIDAVARLRGDTVVGAGAVAQAQQVAGLAVGGEQARHVRRMNAAALRRAWPASGARTASRS